MRKVFYYDGKPIEGEYLVILCGEHGPEELPGYYYREAGELYGPFDTKEEAKNN